jgi:hypothetical protein
VDLNMSVAVFGLFLPIKFDESTVWPSLIVLFWMFWVYCF